MSVRAWTSNALGNDIARRAEIADPQMQVAYLLIRFYSSLPILQAWLKKRKQTNAGLLFSTSWPISTTRAKEGSLNISQNVWKLQSTLSGQHKNHTALNAATKRRKG